MASLRAGPMARRERASTSGTPMVGVTPPPRCGLLATMSSASGEGDPRRGRPLRTAPSMVAGHPVSVHAPATARPARAVRGPGPQGGRARPGSEGGVAFLGDEGVDQAGAGRLGQEPSQLRGDPRHQLVGMAAEQVVGGRDRHRHILRTHILRTAHIADPHTAERPVRTSARTRPCGRRPIGRASPTRPGAASG